MIYKNGIKANKIELIVNEEDQNLICHIHLNNGKVFSGQPEKLDPSTFHNQTKLGTVSILTIAQTLENLKKEME